MAEIDYQSVFAFLQGAREKIESGDPLPFEARTGLAVVEWLRNKAALDKRAKVRKSPPLAPNNGNGGDA